MEREFRIKLMWLTYGLVLLNFAFLTFFVFNQSHIHWESVISWFLSGGALLISGTYAWFYSEHNP